MNTRKLLVLIFFISSILCNDDDSEIRDSLFKIKHEDEYFEKLDFKYIITYDDDNYRERVKTDKPLLIYAYSPYDPSSQDFIDLYIELSEFYKKNKTDLTFTKINIKDNPDFTKEFKIKEVPSIIFIGLDRRRIFYKQEITKYNMIRFLNKRLYGNTMTFETMEEVNKTINDTKYKKNQVFVLSTLAFDHKKDIFNKYADENDREIFIHCFSIECYNEYNEDVVIYKNFDEKIIKYSDHFKSGSDKIEVDKLRKFVQRYSIESGALLINEYFKLSKNYNRKMIIYFRDKNDQNQIKHDINLKEAGLELRKKEWYTFVSDIKDDNFYEKIGEAFIIAPHELPTLLYIDDIDLKDLSKSKTYRITNVNLDKLNKNYILSFVKDVKKNIIKVDLKTQYPSEENEDNDLPYKVVVGRTYDKDVINEKRNVLITFVDRKNTCDLCKKYLNAIKEYKKETKRDISFIVMDGANNEARDINFNEEDLPMIYFYTNAENNKGKYKYNPTQKENINKETLEEFIKETLKSNDIKEDL